MPFITCILFMKNFSNIGLVILLKEMVIIIILKNYVELFLYVLGSEK